MKKVLYYRILNYQPANLKLLKNHFNVISLESPDDDTDELLTNVDVVFAPLGYFFGKEKIGMANNLKIIASNTTGEPHIDVEYAEKKGITIVSLKRYPNFLKTITPTAEHTIGLILAVTRRIPWAFESVLKGAWNRRLFGAKGMLSKMSLGIIGLGRLGSLVAKYAVAFGMDVYYYDPYVEESLIKDIRKINSLEKLVSMCDIITLHVHLGEKTRHLINDRILSKCKDGAYIINTSRGEIIDSDVLLKYLKNGKIGGAALDVFPGEFDRKFQSKLSNHPLLSYSRKHDNLLITPHIGGSTNDAWYLTEEFIIKECIKKLEK